MISPIIDKYQKEHPTKQEKEEALRKMSNEEIDELINASTNIFGKLFYSSFKK